MKVQNDALVDKLARIMQAMSCASQELAALKREVRRLDADNTTLRTELRRLRGARGPGAPVGDEPPTLAKGDTPQPPAVAPG